MKKAILAALVATTAVTAQAKHSPIQLGLETGVQTVSGQSSESLNSGLNVGYEFEMNKQFSITPIAHGGASIYNNEVGPTDLEAKVKYYWEAGTKFTAYTNPEQSMFFYVEPSYKQQRIEFSEKGKESSSQNYRGMGGKVGFGAFVTNTIMVDVSAGQHWMKETSGNKNKQNFRNYTLNVSYAF